MLKKVYAENMVDKKVRLTAINYYGRLYLEAELQLKRCRFKAVESCDSKGNRVRFSQIATTLGVTLPQ